VAESRSQIRLETSKTAENSFSWKPKQLAVVEAVVIGAYSAKKATCKKATELPQFSSEKNRRNLKWSCWKRTHIKLVTRRAVASNAHCCTHHIGVCVTLSHRYGRLHHGGPTEGQTLYIAVCFHARLVEAFDNVPKKTPSRKAYSIGL
jgi:uncharacterized protein (DUF1800 family)